MPNLNPTQSQVTDGSGNPQNLGGEQNSDSLYGTPAHLRVKSGSSWIPATSAMLGTGVFSTIVAHGQITGIPTTPAAALPSHAGAGVLLEAPDTNTDAVLWGDSLGQYHKIWPGDARFIPIANSATIWRKSASSTQTLIYTVFAA
jgi:hypothetical protein